MPHPLRPLSLAFALALSLAAGGAAAQAPVEPGNSPLAAPAQCTDFYSQANASWLAANPPAAGPESVLGQLVEHTRQQQRELLDEAMRAPRNDAQKRLGDLWASGLDEDAVEADGARPIAPLLARIDGIRRGSDVPAVIGELHRTGIPVAFNFAPDFDLKALDRHIGYFMPGGTGLGDPAFYTRDNPSNRATLARYRDYVARMLALTGSRPDQLDADVDAVIAIETAIARRSPSMVALENPFRSYVPVKVRDVARTYPNLQLDRFLRAQGVKDDVVSLPDPTLFAELDSLVAKLPPEQWKAYLRWRVGDAMAPYLSRDFREASRAFRGGGSSREELVLDAINLTAGPMLGREYAARHLPAATRQRAAEVADQVRRAQMAAVDTASWLDPESRAEAKAKLAAVQIEVGAPRRELDYAMPPMDRASFGGNILLASAWRQREEMKRIGRGTPDRRWDVLPQQPSVAYDATRNRLVVTAAVLQAPVFEAGNPAREYGAYGALVGNQLTRAVDARGALVDARGELRSWWSAADRGAWNLLGQRVAAQYANHTHPALAGARVDGARIKEQAISDLAGLELALAAWKRAHPQAGPEQQQAVFFAWSQLWGQREPATAARRGMHAPGPLRSNITLSNLPEFAEAFGCRAGQPMQRAETAQVRIWR